MGPCQFRLPAAKSLGGFVRSWMSTQFLPCACVFLASLSCWGQSKFIRPRITQPVNEKQLSTLRGSVYPLARKEFDQGAAPLNLPMERMLLVLKRSPEQEAALIKLLDEQQDRSSPNFHKWLTPEEYGKQFGPADEDIQTVVSWLQSHGFQVTQVTKGRTVIEFSGTAAQVQEAFHTSIHKFVVNGESHLANASEVEIPSALAPVVAGPWSLHNFYKKPQSRLSKDRITATYQGGATPQVTASNGQHFLGPADYALIYNINPIYALGINGTGATIGVVGRTEIDGNNIFDFKNLFGLGGFVFTTINGPDPGFLSDGEQVEAMLDTTWSSAIAPGALVEFVISASTDTTDGVDLSELYIVENNFTDIMTESFGSCEGFYTQAEADGVASLAEQAAAQGITYIVSSGDSGASGCDRPSQAAATHPISVNMLASTPFNVAVGGTLFNEHGQNGTYWSANNGPGGLSAKTYIPENVWNESCAQAQCGSKANLAATGGGASVFFTKPVWQTGVAGIPGDGKRDIPDVSLTAAGHDPYLLCFQRSCVPDNQGFISFFGISGTSASAPSFAGIMALVKQKTGSRQGQANYVLYQMAAGQSYSQCNGSSTTSSPSASCKFRDVTVGNNIVPGQTTQQYTSGVGYDLATGLGSPNVANLVNNWISLPGTVTTLSLNPTTAVTHGSTVNVNVSVTPSSGPGTPTGDVSLLTTAGQSIDSFTLSGGSASSTTNDLLGGGISVHAHYAGDGHFGASDSDPVTVSVSPEGSTTTLAVLTADQNGLPIPFTTGPYGSFVYPRADVAGQSGHGTPTGAAQFLDNGTPFLTLSLNSQGNTAPPSGVFTLAPGGHAITAMYLGDFSFNQSTSTPVNVTITQANTTTTAYSASNSVLHGTLVTLNSDVLTHSFGNAPSGTVTFFSGATTLGSSPAMSNFDMTTGEAGAFATLQTTQLPVGSDTITATYNGDANYTSSTATGHVINVQADFAPSLSMNSATVSQGGSATATVNVTVDTGFTGTMNFSCTALPLYAKCAFSPATLSGAGSTNLTITTKAPVSASLVPGNPNNYFAWWVGMGTPIAGIFLLGVPRRHRGKWLATVALGLLAVGIGCGGGGSGGGGGGSPGTPRGIYQVNVNASVGGFTHTNTFTLTVQ
jgi:Pro-kumamolisin, activation domain/Bacterial Ig-like domain (group 3)